MSIFAISLWLSGNLTIPLFLFSSGFCDIDTTIDNSSLLGDYTWKETLAGTNQIQECEFGGGMALRLCNSESDWEEPDLSGCISRTTTIIQKIVDVSCSAVGRFTYSWNNCYGMTTF